jgi:hypothetical protein
VVAELALVAQTTAPAVVRATEPESEPDLTSVAFFSPQSERDVPAEEPRLIVFPRFFRLELVAC